MDDPIEGATIGQSGSEPAAQYDTFRCVSDRNATQVQDRAPNFYDIFDPGFGIQPYGVEYHQSQDSGYYSSHDFLSLQNWNAGIEDVEFVSILSEAELSRCLSSDSLSMGAGVFGEPTVATVVPAQGSLTRASSFELQTPALTSGAPSPQSQAAENLVAIDREANLSRPIRCKPTAKVTYCSFPGCRYSTTSKMWRHQLVHQMAGPGSPRWAYACQCGAHAGRKDSMERHMKTCSKEPQDDYACQSHGSFTDRQQFLAHMKKCGRRPGRPTKRGVAAAARDGGAAEWDD
ncbi:hypothetical protein V8E51_014600 [Hyaloscypha variabilis]